MINKQNQNTSVTGRVVTHIHRYIARNFVSRGLKPKLWFSVNSYPFISHCTYTVSTIHIYTKWAGTTV